MFGHFAADKSVTFAFFVLSSPDFAELVDDLLALHFFPAHLALIPLASAPGSFSDPGFGSFFSFYFFVHHLIVAFPVFDGDEGLRPASVPQSFFNESGIHALVF